MCFNFSKSNTDKNVAIWLLMLTISVFFIIIIGGLTRLTESGLSMVDWRPIMGTIPPLTNFEWSEIFNQYKKTPEFKIVNKSMTLAEFKFIFWWEWFHRFFARLIGVLFLIPFCYFIIKNKISKNLFFILLIVFIFGLFQAIIGWWMVKSGLTNNPYVSAYRLTFHLVNALIIFCILFWTFLNYSFNNEKKIINKKIINNFFHLALILLFITIISGGFMAGTHSGQSFNTFPLMNEKFIPEDYFINDLGILNFFENTVAINFNHRWLAAFTFIIISSGSLYLLFTSKYNKNKHSLILVLIAISMQFFLGVVTLINNVPIIFASLHQTNSVILLAFLLYAYHRHKYINNENN